MLATFLRVSVAVTGNSNMKKTGVSYLVRC